jgi:hypothetical protein
MKHVLGDRRFDSQRMYTYTKPALLAHPIHPDGPCRFKVWLPAACWKSAKELKELEACRTAWQDKAVGVVKGVEMGAVETADAMDRNQIAIGKVSTSRGGVQDRCEPSTPSTDALTKLQHKDESPRGPAAEGEEVENHFSPKPLR